jgi:transcription-repair coupling factor (superfamily II helicase)
VTASPPLGGLLDLLLERSAELRGVVAQARPGSADALDVTAPPSARAALVAALTRSRPLVVAVTATSREAEELQAEVGDLIDPHDVALYPAWETLPHERLSPRSDTVGQRLAVLRRLAHPEGTPGRGRPRVLVTPVRAVLQPQAAGLGDLEPVHLRVGSATEQDDLVRRLSAAGYQRVDLVERRGEFAVRGGLVDVFPPVDDHPRRIELWGDEVAEIRAFAVADQRSLDLQDEVYAPPCRELLLTPEVRSRAGEVAVAHPELADLLAKVAEGVAVEGMESLAPVLLPRMELLLDVLPADGLLLVCDPERVRRRAHDLAATDAEFAEASWGVAAEGGKAPIDLGAASFRSLADVRSHALGRGQAWWSTSPFQPGPDDGDEADEAPGPAIDLVGVPGRSLGWRPPPAYRGDLEQALEQVRRWQREGWLTLVTAPGPGTVQRAAEVLAEAGVASRVATEVTADPVVQVLLGRWASGFVDPTGQVAVLTERDLTGRDPTASRSVQRMPSRRRHQVDPLTCSLATTSCTSSTVSAGTSR